MDQYADQLRLIFHVVMTNSGWGQVRLLREWFVHEWGFLKAQLPLLVQMRETSLAGKKKNCCACPLFVYVVGSSGV